MAKKTPQAINSVLQILSLPFSMQENDRLVQRREFSVFFRRMHNILCTSRYRCRRTAPIYQVCVSLLQILADEEDPMCQPKRNTERREHNKNNNKSTFSVFKNVEGEENPGASAWGGKAVAGWGFHSRAGPITSSSGKEMCARKRK